MRVEASRSMSREFYAVGLGRKKPQLSMQQAAAGAAQATAKQPGKQPAQQLPAGQHQGQAGTPPRA